ncbi:MAG: 50S ribosomal protein L25 [Candidatus Omnitrophota bacterium]
MEEVKLEAQIRNKIGTAQARAVRREEDMIPGVVYGGDKDPTLVKVDTRTYMRIRRQHQGEILLHLDVREGDKKLRDYSAIVKDEQHNPVSGRVIHIDFLRISLKDKIEVNIPLEAQGEPVGVTRDGGSLDHILWELDVVCLPTDMPESIKVDVAELEIGDNIHLKDITLPAGLETEHDPEAILFSVVPPMKEEEPAEVEEDAEPEVLSEKKEEGEEGEAAEDAAGEAEEGSEEGKEDQETKES